MAPLPFQEQGAKAHKIAMAAAKRLHTWKMDFAWPYVLPTLKHEELTWNHYILDYSNILDIV